MVKRLIELENVALFGAEAIVTTIDGCEELSQPFEFILTIASPKESLKPEQVIGQPLAFRIDRGDEDPRYVHGYVCQFWAENFVPHDSTAMPFRFYRIKLVPWIWFMSRAARCFVYLPEKKEKSIQDVLDAIVKRVKSYGHVEPTLDHANAKVLSSRKVEHCVQYRESDLNFLSRTLERYGVYYCFQHEATQHKLILSDQSNYPKAIEAEPRFPRTSNNLIHDDVITSWVHAYEFVSGKWEQTDYDFTHPSTDLKVNASKHASIPLKNNAAYEVYEYPGEYIKRDDGEAEVAIRLEAEESRFNTVDGESTCKTFSPGYCFKLTEHPTCKDEVGKTYLLTSVRHTIRQPGPYAGDAAPTSYTNTFTCIPRDSQFRPPRRSSAPSVASVQTAIVVGPAGEEIYTDEFGRVKIQFHWDREGKRDENTSCWVRVCQSHAGKGFGGIDIPRIGEEVVVSFLEGDLDRPLITGRVYHKEAMPPFGLPAAKTVSGIKTKTYKGKGYNELSMDDTPGKEKINVHAQYDMATTVEHDQSLTVKNDRSNTILGKLSEVITKDTSITVVSGAYSHKVVDNTAKYFVKGDLTEDYTANQTTNVKQTIKISSETQEIVLTAKTKITLQVGQSKLVMVSDGTIDLTGVKITVDGKELVHCNSDKILHTGGTEAKLGVGSQNIACSQTKTEISGTAINSSAVGMHEISGALVKIN